MVQAKKSICERVCQGDIIRDVDFVERYSLADGLVEISVVRFPLVIVLTQDCDLNLDHCFRTEQKPTHDKLMISALVVPLYNWAHLQDGKHLSLLDRTCQQFGKNDKRRDLLEQNQLERYHYLDIPSEWGVPTLVADFKHYFSLPVEELERASKSGFVCTVCELYREDISHRFASFLSRIGLPSA